MADDASGSKRPEPVRRGHGVAWQTTPAGRSASQRFVEVMASRGRRRQRVDRILSLVSDGWKRYPEFRLGQFLEIVAESHHLGTIPDYELERRLKDPSTWLGPPAESE